MNRTLHVVFDGTVFRPEEPLDLEPNTHYIVTIESKKTSLEKDLWDVLENLSGTIEGPQDWSKEHNHYLYGTQKGGKT